MTAVIPPPCRHCGALLPAPRDLPVLYAVAVAHRILRNPRWRALLLATPRRGCS